VTGGWGTPQASGTDAPELGETFVAGKTPETAQALLAACRTLDMPTLLVKTTASGFVVPNAVYDQYANDQAEHHGI
jgi:hypothetical protein